MDMQREIKDYQTRRRPRPGGRSSDTPVAKDGGQDIGDGMRGSQDRIRIAGRAGVRSIYSGPIHTAQGKEEKGTIMQLRQLLRTVWKSDCIEYRERPLSTLANSMKIVREYQIEKWISRIKFDQESSKTKIFDGFHRYLHSV